ncbi:MAG: RIP metalloprotease RseP [Methylophilales bacterium]|nr:RIP metalloprotease RseP [Methylophilales bacterium]
MLTLLAFLLTLAVLIVVHEYGHYIVARWCGVKVLRFSVGFGRALYTRIIKHDGTELVLAAFPFGGYVKMLDEREAPVAEADLSRAYNRQNVWKRSAIVVAGPLANLLLAVALYWVLFISGVAELKPVVGEVPPNSVAAQASIKAGELITKIDGKKINSWEDVRWSLLQHALKGKQVEVEAVIGNETFLHRVDMSHLQSADFDTDVLEKMGFIPARPFMAARVGEVLPDGAAQRDGLMKNDLIRSVNGVPVPGWEAFVQRVRESANKILYLEIERAGKVEKLELTPSTELQNGVKVGHIGAAYRMQESELKQYLTEVRYPPLSALSHAVIKTWDTSVLSLKMLGNMLLGTVSWKGVSGPITIANLAGQTAQLGWKSFMAFLALVSVSLGVLNLLPVPVLDGGHLMYHTVEIIRGAPVSDAAMEIGQRVGLALLGLLITVALYNDLSHLIHSL